MRNLVTMMVGVAILGAAVSANAQTSTSTGLSARMGVFSPTDKATRAATEDGWFGFGVDYKLGQKLPMAPMGELGFSLDYSSKGGTRIIPLSLNYKVKQDKFYVFGGVGASLVHPDGGKSDTLFGYQLGAGMDFAQQGGIPLFLEAKFLGTEKSEYNGFGFYAGVRF